MNCMIVIFFAVLVAINAKPYYGPGLGYGGGGYGSGYGYGDSGYASGNQGQLNSGYGSNVLNAGHNVGYQNNEYDAAVHHRQSTAHNIGGTTAIGGGGYGSQGYGGYGLGHSQFGSGWSNGFGFI